MAAAGGRFRCDFSGLTYHINGAIRADMEEAHYYWSCRADFAA
jgi:hypothetical protein